MNKFITVAKDLVTAVALFALVGCTAGTYLGSTEAWYTAEGTWYYKSNKNQENFKASLNNDGSFSVSTDANTPEAAMAKAAESNAKLSEALTTLAKMLVEASALAAKVPIK